MFSDCIFFVGDLRLYYFFLKRVFKRFGSYNKVIYKVCMYDSYYRFIIIDNKLIMVCVYICLIRLSDNYLNICIVI